MRVIIKFYLLICSIMLMSICGSAWADSLTPQPLALSSEEIVKLNHYFPTNNFSSVQNNNDFNPTIPAHIVWDGETPIVIILPVGKERIIHFPGQVQFGYDRSLLPSYLLQVQNNNETLYLTAYQAFPTQRVKIKLVNSGKIIYLDLSAKNQGASNIPLDVVIQNPEENLPATQQNSEETNISYLTLTRFAAQQLYAPQRLITEASADIYRTPMHTSHTVPLLLDGSVIAMPLASWRGGDLTVTAVLLRNQLQQSIDLDPRQLCGDWRAATFFPQNQLSKAGEPRDTTTVFLVSDSSFGDVMNQCEGGVK